MMKEGYVEERIAALRGERDAWKKVCEAVGVCMSCALGPPEPYGCTDCLNTGWRDGAPFGFIRDPDAGKNNPSDGAFPVAGTE